MIAKSSISGRGVPVSADPIHLSSEENAMQTEDLRDLYIDQLKDLYSAENQLVKALAKMAKSSTNEELKSGFEEHLEQTKTHAQRIEQIMEKMGESPKGKKCKA